MPKTEIQVLNQPFQIVNFLSNKVSVNQQRKNKRNRLRILRRKRSKFNYWKQRKELRLKRKVSTDLNRTVSLFNVMNVNMNYNELAQKSFIQPIEEIGSWQSQHAIAYWKSRAMALEIENKMLYKHIRRVYTQQIQEYNQDFENQSNNDISKTSEEYGTEKIQKQIWEAPNEHPTKQREKVMIRKYGNMACKISGMETAIQLNYDSYLDKHQPIVWPNIPLNL